MKNSEIAQVFRDTAEVLDLLPDEESVAFDQECIVLAVNNPMVGSIRCKFLPRRTPVMTVDTFRRLMASSRPGDDAPLLPENE